MRDRHLERVIRDALGSFRVVMIQGTRQTGSGAAWQRASFGTKRSRVQIPPARPPPRRSRRRERRLGVRRREGGPRRSETGCRIYRRRTPILPLFRTR